ncbi:hypothetical protein MKEN_00108900 [Mycena kentingensis (nom. inval.)]|nr:hypothetical protein MKEN_00108900 [Mycena kentingensis (nom. inval.)]
MSNPTAPATPPPVVQRSKHLKDIEAAHDADLVPVLHLDNRNPDLPRLFRHVGPHPHWPTATGHAYVYYDDSTREGMAAAREVELRQRIPSGTADEMGKVYGLLELHAGDMVVCRAANGSRLPKDDFIVAWGTDVGLVSAAHIAEFDQVRQEVLGNRAQRTEGAPTVKTVDGKAVLVGGTAFERNPTTTPVKAGTRCFTLGPSYQRPKNLHAPNASVKVNGGPQTAEAADLSQRLFSAGMHIAASAMAHGPPSVAAQLTEKASLYNTPPYSIEENAGYYKTGQLNIAPAEKDTPTSEDSSIADLGSFGGLHEDMGDSAGDYTNMTVASDIPEGEDYEDCGRFHLVYPGVFVALDGKVSFNFCGLFRHGGTAPRCRPGGTPHKWVYRLIIVSYPPDGMANGKQRVPVGYLPNGFPLIFGPEIVNAGIRYRINQGHLPNGEGNPSVWNRDGIRMTDPALLIAFILRWIMLLLFYLLMQLPAHWNIAFYPEHFEKCVSFKLEGQPRRTTGRWNHAPGFRRTDDVPSSDPSADIIPDEVHDAMVDQEVVRTGAARRADETAEHARTHIPSVGLRAKSTGVSIFMPSNSTDKSEKKKRSPKSKTVIPKSGSGKPKTRSKPKPKPAAGKVGQQKTGRRKPKRQAKDDSDESDDEDDPNDPDWTTSSRSRIGHRTGKDAEKRARIMARDASTKNLINKLFQPNNLGKFTDVVFEESDADAAEVASVLLNGDTMETDDESISGDAALGPSNRMGQSGTKRPLDVDAGEGAGPSKRRARGDQDRGWASALLDDDATAKRTRKHVQQRDQQATRFLRSLTSDAIFSDLQDAEDARTALLRAADSSPSPTPGPLPLSAIIKVLDAAPGDKNTAGAIVDIWPNIEQFQTSANVGALRTKLQREIVMGATWRAWGWLYGFCGAEIRRALKPTNEKAEQTWLTRLAERVHTVVLLRNPSAKFASTDFGLELDAPTYEYSNKRARRYDEGTEPLHDAVVKLGLRVVAHWLKFPAFESVSRLQAYFVSCIIDELGHRALLLSPVWMAYNAVRGHVLNNSVDPQHCETVFKHLRAALRAHPLADPNSEENRALVRLGQIAEWVVDPAVALPDPTSVPPTALPTTTEDQPAPAPLPSPHPLLDLSPLPYNEITSKMTSFGRMLDQAIQIALNRDDGTPSAWKDVLRRDPDKYMPFRHFGPSLRRAMSSEGPYVSDIAETEAGFFSALTFRGVTFATEFARGDGRLVYQDTRDFKLARNDATSLYKATNQGEAPPPGFFCNQSAYGPHNLHRKVEDATTYGQSVQQFKLSRLVKDARAVGETVPLVDLAHWIENSQLRGSKAFPGLGPLGAYLIAADYTYTNPRLVGVPSFDDMGQVICDLNKGAAKGLELLGLIPPRPLKSVTKKGVEKLKPGRSTPQDCSAGLRTLYRYLQTRWSVEIQRQVGLDLIMLEHTLCKLARASSKSYWNLDKM